MSNPVQKILLIKRRALGDTVLLTGVIELLKLKFPKSEISVLVPAPYAAVFHLHPNVKSIFTFKSPNILLTLLKIRNQRFDLAFEFQGHSSIFRKLVLRLCGAKKHYFHRRDIETTAAYPKHPNALEWAPFFLNSIFKEEKSLPTAPWPQIFLSEVEIKIEKDKLATLGARPSRYVFLGLGASRITKRWPAKYFAKFAQMLSAELKLTPILVSGENTEDLEFTNDVVTFMNGVGLVGRYIQRSGLSVRELAACIANCDMYVGNDSGPKHIAVAVGIPTLTIFGPEDPMEWHPYQSEKHQYLYQKSFTCRQEDNGRWCGIKTCTVHKHQCMQTIKPEAVFQRFKEMYLRPNDQELLLPEFLPNFENFSVLSQSPAYDQTTLVAKSCVN